MGSGGNAGDRAVDAPEPDARRTDISGPNDPCAISSSTNVYQNSLIFLGNKAKVKNALPARADTLVQACLLTSPCAGAAGPADRCLIGVAEAATVAWA